MIKYPKRLKEFLAIFNKIRKIALNYKYIIKNKYILF